MEQRTSGVNDVMLTKVYDLYAERRKKCEQYEVEWNALFAKYAEQYPAEAAEIKRRFSKQLPEGWASVIPRFTPTDPPLATRKASEMVINALASIIPDFMSGSADLSSSNLVRWKGATDFQHVSCPQCHSLSINDSNNANPQIFQPSTGLGDYKGQYLLYGVREHGMFAIMNGFACYGGFIPIGATFLNFLT